MRCIDCDFDLANSAIERRCPECGRAFDPADAATVIGPGHGRLSRALARAPRWVLAVGAAVVAILVLRVDFSPSRSFGPSIGAGVACVVLAMAWLVRAGLAVIGHRTLPRRRPRVVPIAPWRWLLPLAIVGVALLADAVRLPRALAFRLDRSRLEALASGPTVEPSVWVPTGVASGTVERGGVWVDAWVWTFEGDDTRRWTRETGLTPYGLALARLVEGDAESIANAETLGMRRRALPRLAIFPIAGLGYGSMNDPAWAYAPAAPDGFGLGGEFGTSWFRRYDGDWFVSEGWIWRLEDGAGWSARPSVP